MANVIRVGLGKTKSGKILDRETQWFNADSQKSLLMALERFHETHKPLFISRGNKAYEELSLQELLDMIAES